VVVRHNVSKSEVHDAWIKAAHLGSQFLSELLYPVMFYSVEDDDAIDLVKRSNQLFTPNHLACDRGDGTARQGKGSGEEVEGKAVVVRSVGEQIRSKTLLLDFSVDEERISTCYHKAIRVPTYYLPRQSLLDLGRVLQQGPDLDRQDEVLGLFPMSVLQSLAGLHDVVSCTLGRSHKGLPVGLLEKPPERPANGLSLGLVSVERSQQGDLDQHGRDEESSLEELEVDVHVERQKTPLFDEFLLRGVLRESLDSLSQQLLGTLRGKDLEQGRLTFGKVTLLEGGKTDLNDDSVVQDLSGDVGVLDRVLEVAHQEHVPGLVILAVERVVVDVAQHGSGSDERRSITVQVDGERVDEVVGLLRGGDVGDVGRLAGQGSDGAPLENVDDGRRLVAGPT
jgi:hypothetical protein